MLDTLSRNWWMLVARGAFAILFGVLAILMPGLTLTALVLLFGAYALIDGGITLYSTLTGRNDNQQWWLGLLEGGIGVIAGIVTFVWPGITGLALLYVIAFWAIMTGVFEIMAAWQLRKEIANEILLGISGLLSVVFGGLLLAFPGSGALAVAWLIGFYAILFGGTLIALGFRLRSDDPEKMVTAS